MSGNGWTAVADHHVRYRGPGRRAECSCGWRSHKRHSYRAALAHLECMRAYQHGWGLFTLTG